jgi:ABC-type antimicrobial peptide transport system permease subunit
VTRDDLDRGRAVAVVSESAARRLWPGVPLDSIIGRELTAMGQPARRVIGVVADIRDRPDRATESRIFAAALPENFFFFSYAVRTDEAGLDVNGLRRALAASHAVPGVTVVPAGAARRNALEQPQAQALIFGSFAIVGLLLAALGLFAVASFEVALRRYELGVRVALGASARQIRRLMVGESLKPVALGVLAGLAVAYWAAEFAQSLVHQVDAREPWTMAIVAVVLIVTAAFAAWLPARRAARVDPIVTLRAE